MGLTLSHISALDVMRELRHGNHDIREMTTIDLRRPLPPSGLRWTKKSFGTDEWRWATPSEAQPLHVLVPSNAENVRMSTVESHIASRNLPAKSIIWLDTTSSMVCPELLFCQMAEWFSLPALVMLGFELCGCFVRDPTDPLNGDAKEMVSPATSVDLIRDYLDSATRIRGIARARNALRYVCDNALSVPEGLLGTLYSLPAFESGYGMGPIALNRRVDVSHAFDARPRFRFPDLMLGFAPVGINYEGEGHLNLRAIDDAVQKMLTADEEGFDEAQRNYHEAISAIRSKVVDDTARNRELASAGRIVFPVYKEDIRDGQKLDDLTWRFIECAHNVFGVNTQPYERILNDSDLTRDRHALLESLLPGSRPRGASHGVL